ncbi:unnamed protein product [Lasius platythorax]|uniref:Uncharacterized protein n=2 Tax=Lasius platythorax TaxID=488582 RepID=A0AAV2NNN0_9HYME
MRMNENFMDRFASIAATFAFVPESLYEYRRRGMKEGWMLRVGKRRWSTRICPDVVVKSAELGCSLATDRRGSIMDGWMDGWMAGELDGWMDTRSEAGLS